MLRFIFSILRSKPGKLSNNHHTIMSLILKKPCGEIDNSFHMCETPTLFRWSYMKDGLGYEIIKHRQGTAFVSGFGEDAIQGFRQPLYSFSLSTAWRCFIRPKKGSWFLFEKNEGHKTISRNKFKRTQMH